MDAQSSLWGQFRHMALKEGIAAPSYLSKLFNSLQ